MKWRDSRMILGFVQNFIHLCTVLCTWGNQSVRIFNWFLSYFVRRLVVIGVARNGKLITRFTKPHCFADFRPTFCVSFLNVPWNYINILDSHTTLCISKYNICTKLVKSSDLSQNGGGLHFGWSSGSQLLVLVSWRQYWL